MVAILVFTRLPGNIFLPITPIDATRCPRMELGNWFDAVPRHALDQMHFVSHVAAFRQSDHQEQATRVDDWNGLNWVIGLRVLGWLNWYWIGMDWGCISFVCLLSWFSPCVGPL